MLFSTTFMIPNIKLKSNQEMPALGLGTWELQGQTCKDPIKKAIELGYTHIDTAWIYENQNEIGQALKEINVDRNKLFITSKVWRNSLSYDELLEQCDQTLKQLQTNYLDLYLIHWPNRNIPIKDSMRALKKLVDEGKAKSVGVSNFSVNRLKEALEVSEVPISVNQVEFHPELDQEDLLKFCKENNIILTAYSPLGRGRILNNSTLQNIAQKHNKTTAQICLKWALQKGMIVIPKSSSEEHLKANMDIFDWKLSEEDIEQINELGKGKRFVDPAFEEWD